MKSFIILLSILLASSPLAAQTEADSVTICGRVTDYNDMPLDSVSVCWQSTTFATITEVLTDKDGYYKARIKKGKYYAMGALNMSQYIVTGSELPEKDQRLEFWGWNFIADRDTTFDMQYHRMEAYGVHVFNVRGGTPGYTIYVRPMSLTRYQQWAKDKTPESLLAPSPGNAEIAVTINGTATPVRMIQEIKEYFEPGQYGNAYLLFVDPVKTRNGLPYDIFRIRITDKENGDKGEAVYFREKEQFVK